MTDVVAQRLAKRLAKQNRRAYHCGVDEAKRWLKRLNTEEWEDSIAGDEEHRTLHFARDIFQGLRFGLYREPSSSSDSDSGTAKRTTECLEIVHNHNTRRLRNLSAEKLLQLATGIAIARLEPNLKTDFKTALGARDPSAHEHVKYWTPELVATARLQKRFYGANKRYLDATDVGMCAVMVAEYALEHLQQPPSVPVVAAARTAATAPSSSILVGGGGGGGGGGLAADAPSRAPAQQSVRPSAITLSRASSGSSADSSSTDGTPSPPAYDRSEGTKNAQRVPKVIRTSTPLTPWKLVHGHRDALESTEGTNPLE